MNTTTFDLLEAEMNKISKRLDEMHSTSNWNTKMEKEEKQLNFRYMDLQESFNILNSQESEEFTNPNYK
jgi:hypothetical protein